MDPIPLILILAGAGIALLVGELLLPTHGVLGVMGLLFLGVAIGFIFKLNKWAGLTVFLTAIVASPFLLNLSMKLWMASPVGRRMVLQPVDSTPAPSPVRPGQVGVTVTELRPTGEVEFGDVRVEAVSQLGMIAPGRQVRVISLDGGRPTVRAVETS